VEGYPLSTNQTRFFAPAKLNLFLHVVGRREDGYHELQTLFRFLDFGDWLEFIPTPETAIDRTSGNEAVSIDEDLIIRAARLLQSQSGCSRGVEISVEKKIPLGAGLGGGSSDAATTLLALNQLWGLGLSSSELKELGLSLGADVPVFIQGHSAWAEGVGDRLSAVELPPATYLVVIPPVNVSTSRIFLDSKLTRNSPLITIADYQAGESRNDLEKVTCRLYPEMGEVLEWLGDYGRARMTGSGAAVFIELENTVFGQSVLAQMPEMWRGFIAQGVDFHPFWRNEH